MHDLRGPESHNLSKLCMNVNIVKTLIVHNIRFDLKGHWRPLINIFLKSISDFKKILWNRLTLWQPCYLLLAYGQLLSLSLFSCAYAAYGSGGDKTKVNLICVLPNNVLHQVTNLNSILDFLDYCGLNLL